MIARLASPSICVIDDDKADYEPILKALTRLGFAHTHIRGTNPTKLRPLKGIRLVFTDLHLAGQVGKDAASYTANVFRALFPNDTAPLVVIIWSKYSDDPAGEAGLPPSDQPSEAEVFKQTLIGAVPAFKESLVFCEMKKPKVNRRPKGGKWITKLKRDIQGELAKIPAFDVLWEWECLVRDASIQLTEQLARLAQRLPGGEAETGAATLHERLQNALKILAQECGGPDCTPATAPRHLVAMLAQTLADHVEHLEISKPLKQHGVWLGKKEAEPNRTVMAAGLNGLLMTAAQSQKQHPFTPGTVYRFTKAAKLRELFGVEERDLLSLCYSGSQASFDEWRNGLKAKPVLLEISPACDVQQRTRRNALLIGGLIIPVSGLKKIKRADAIEILPTFSLRWPAAGFDKQDAALVFFSRFKVTLQPKREPTWLKAWFRLRELPAASLRNWHAGHAARVGYVSLR
jgi:hypothetical protein